MNSVDLLGRRIHPAVLSVAQQIGPNAIRYAEKLLGDPALVMNLFEQAAATVSEALEKKARLRALAVRTLTAYLFRTFIRMAGQERRKEARLKQKARRYAGRQVPWREVVRAETLILVDEVMRESDSNARNCASLSGRLAYVEEGFFNKLTDEDHVRLAVLLAKKAYDEGGCPIGGVIISDETRLIVGKGHNTR